MRLLCTRAYARGSTRYEPGCIYDVGAERAILLLRSGRFRLVPEDAMRAIEEPPQDKMIRRQEKEHPVVHTKRVRRK